MCIAQRLKLNTEIQGRVITAFFIFLSEIYTKSFKKVFENYQKGVIILSVKAITKLRRIDYERIHVIR